MTFEVYRKSAAALTIEADSVDLSLGPWCRFFVYPATLVAAVPGETVTYIKVKKDG
jgi:hypothetical protein